LDSNGHLLMECVLETKAATLLQFVQGLRGSVQVTLEEGTCAAWLHDLLKPHVTEVLVCNPRKNALLKMGNKNDRVDARKLAELLRSGLLSPVYHGENGVRTLRELARSYLALTRDVMNRVKAIYRSWAIPCTGQRVYSPHDRSEWLGKIPEAAVRHRAEVYYQQLDALRALREQARPELLAEGRQHRAMHLLRQIPSIGPIRAVLLMALIQTPHRFRTKRQLWAYSGLALKTSISGEYRFVEGQRRRSKQQLAIRGLNSNHDLKNIFKGAAIRAAAVPGPLQQFYTDRVATGMKPAMARLTLARKIAAITLIVWKKGVGFDAEHLQQQAA
jgi:transposase